MARAIAHIDADAFYVSVELQRRPELRGKPVVIAGSGPRAVVTTASYEARPFGVHSAIPAERARRLCPDAIFLDPDFKTYRAVSATVMTELRKGAATVEVVGLDEAYVDLSDGPYPVATAQELKHGLREASGLSFSVGLGPNKLVAKVASDAEKPDGFVVLSEAQARERFAGEPCSLIPGIGPKTAARLDQLGIETLGRLAATPEAELERAFGSRLGPHLRRRALFEDDGQVEPVRPAKSESRERTFQQDVRSLPELEQELRRQTEELCSTLERQGRCGRTVGIKVRLDDFSTHTRARTLPAPVSGAAEVAPVALDLLRQFAPSRPVRLVGVRVAGLDEQRAAPAGAPEGEPTTLWAGGP